MLFHVITDVVQKLVLFPREHGSHSNLFFFVLFMFYKCSIQKTRWKTFNFWNGVLLILDFWIIFLGTRKNLNKASGARARQGSAAHPPFRRRVLPDHAVGAQLAHLPSQALIAWSCLGERLAK